MNESGFLFLVAITLLSPHMTERFSKISSVVCLVVGWVLMIIEAHNT